MSLLTQSGYPKSCFLVPTGSQEKPTHIHYNVQSSGRTVHSPSLRRSCPTGGRHPCWSPRCPLPRCSLGWTGGGQSRCCLAPCVVGEGGWLLHLLWHPLSSPWLRMPGYPMTAGSVGMSQELEHMALAFCTFPILPPQSTPARGLPLRPCRMLQIHGLCGHNPLENWPEDTPWLWVTCAQATTQGSGYPGRPLFQLVPNQPEPTKPSEAELCTHSELHRCSKVVPSPAEEEGDWAISPTPLLILEEGGGRHERRGVASSGESSGQGWL